MVDGVGAHTIADVTLMDTVGVADSEGVRVGSEGGVGARLSLVTEMDDEA